MTKKVPYLKDFKKNESCRIYLNVIFRAKDGCGQKLEEWINNLAMHIANTIFVIDPDILILGGGIMNSQLYFFSQLKEKVYTALNKDYRYQLPIVASTDYEISPLMGAWLDLQN